jgi:hypothetical protein
VPAFDVNGRHSRPYGLALESCVPTR